MIPPNAECVFSGIRYDLYHRHQELFDGTMKTYEVVVKKPTLWILPTAGFEIYAISQKFPDGSSYLGLASTIMYDESKNMISVVSDYCHNELGLSANQYSVFDTYRTTGSLRTHDTIVIASDVTITSNIGNMVTCNYKAHSFDEYIALAEKNNFYAPRGFLRKLHRAQLSTSFKNKLAQNIFKNASSLSSKIG